MNELQAEYRPKATEALLRRCKLESAPSIPIGHSGRPEGGAPADTGLHRRNRSVPVSLRRPEEGRWQIVAGLVPLHPCTRFITKIQFVKEASCCWHLGHPCDRTNPEHASPIPDISSLARQCHLTRHSIRQTQEKAGGFLDRSAPNQRWRDYPRRCG